MNLGADINLLIKVVLAVAALYGLTLLGITIFMGFESAKTMLRYTCKFWWLIAGVIAFIMVAKKVSGKKSKRDEISSKIEELTLIENKTKEDKQELKRLEKEKKKIEDEIVATTNTYKDKLDKLKEKPSKPEDVKPGDAGKAGDALNDAWK
jgi:septal ring factor EnvC (AmiA/AmiB activator)